MTNKDLKEGKQGEQGARIYEACKTTVRVYPGWCWISVWVSDGDGERVVGSRRSKDKEDFLESKFTRRPLSFFGFIEEEAATGQNSPLRVRGTGMDAVEIGCSTALEGYEYVAKIIDMMHREKEAGKKPCICQPEKQSPKKNGTHSCILEKE